MTEVAIVREDGILDGRWHLAGTTIPVAEVRIDYSLWDHEHPLVYGFLGLSSEQIGAALAFEFPALFETSITMLYSSFLFGCVCGEETSKTFTGFLESAFECACGRAWIVTLTVYPAPEKQSGPSD